MSDTTPHRAMRRTIFRAIAPAFALLCLLGASPAALAQNLVANPGFENNPPPNFGNNIGWPISPWQLGPGQTSNVVKVDGPGGYNYGNSGPQSDADPAHAAGQQRHYLDIASGDNDVFQTFVVPSCGSTPGQQREVGFSGWFSTRDNLSGNGSISIRQGAGVTGPILKQVSVSLPAPASSGTAPWVQASGTVMVAAGSTITFDVFITDNLNFDQASMTFNATTCASSQLTLRKTWVNAKVNDTATVTATRNGTQIDSLASVANSINETDTDATAVTVFQGEAITLAEAMGTGVAEPVTVD